MASHPVRGYYIAEIAYYCAVLDLISRQNKSKIEYENRKKTGSIPLEIEY